MNILLIGHEGYLGRSLLAYLSRTHHVVGWDKKEDLFQLKGSILARENIEILINLSVMADVQHKNFEIDTPSDEVNVIGARHIARILKGSQIAWFQFSTREVLSPIYSPDDVIKTDVGYRPKFLVDESAPYAPRNRYGKSKIIAEFISESHPFSNVIRLGTPYNDNYHPSGGLILQLIKTVVEGRPLTLTRGGEQFRDPLHTDDLARLMEQLYERKAFGEKIHAGGGEKNFISLREIVQIADPQVKIKQGEGGDYGFAYDVRKARELCGWEPRVLVRQRIPVIAGNIRARPPAR
jgi:nucleoside-diphosphate-sugar epimerase